MANFLNINESLTSSNALKLAGGALVGLSALYCGKIWYSYSFFKKINIETPEYKFFWGNTEELYAKQYSNCLFEWTKKYGKLYGYYEGHLPVLVTSDVDMVNEIFVKQFNHFSSRKMGIFQVADNMPFAHLLDSNQNRWKRMRNVINPTFTPAKLKDLVPLLNLCTERFVSIIDQNQEKEINISQKLKSYTMDNIWNCAFGIDINCQGDDQNMYFKKANEFFEVANSYSLQLSLLIYFPELRPVIMPILEILSVTIGKFKENFSLPVFWIKNNIKGILEKRIKNNIHKKDYMQLLIDAQDENFDRSNDYKEYNLNVRLEKKLTFEEVNGNLLAFLLAGYETTSTTLSYCFWVLASHPEELKKLQHEIDTNFDLVSNDKDVELNYENVNQLEYLDMFIKEVLRMFPIGNNVCNRRCTERTKVKDIQFEKEMIIAIDVLSIHYSQDNWGPEDVHNFYPLRHSPKFKRNPAAFLPFGYGPRSCVGQRFALLEVKLALTKVLMKFDVVKAPSTLEKMVYAERLSVRQPMNGVSCIFKKRVL